MLNNLFGSEAKVKILNLFLLHPEVKYEISKITRDLQLTANSARHEIENLLNLGLVKVSSGQVPESEENKKNQENKDLPKKKTIKNKKEKAEKILEKKYYEINENFILYPEIRALFVKAQILSSQKFITVLEKNFQPKMLVLTGFFTNYPEAQTDILVVGTVKRPQFLKMIAELEKDLGREINFTILEEKEFKYRHEIMDIFLFNILEGKSITLIDNLSYK